MKLAVQEDTVPGDDLSEKIERAEVYGFKGMEFWGKDILRRTDEIKEALASSTLEASTICSAHRGCLLDADKGEREKATRELKMMLQAGSEIGVVGVIMVPISLGPRVPDLSPYASTREIERNLLVLELGELGAYAEEVGCRILLEPVNRHETHLIRTLKDAVRITELVGMESVKIMADFFHMSIEEPDIPTSLEEAGAAIYHVHLADGWRLSLPGQGDTDFRSAFAALKRIGYDKYLALDCGMPENADEALPKCVRYLRSCM